MINSLANRFGICSFPLSRFVDFYTLPTHNLTAFNNATFHHSRLMGVSDINNAVSHETSPLSN